MGRRHSLSVEQPRVWTRATTPSHPSFGGRNNGLGRNAVSAAVAAILSWQQAIAGRDRVLGIVWTPMRLRGLRHALWIGAALQVVYCLGMALDSFGGVDAHAYWAAWRHGLYSAAPEQRDAYLYSPVFAQVLWPLTLLPWPVFWAVWTITLAAAFAWLLAPLGRRWALPLLLMCLPEILTGNVWAFFALVLVLGFRYPAAWAFPLLLKVSPGVGVVWFAVRREWRAAATATAATAAIMAASFALAPDLWGEWLRLLAHPESFRNPARESFEPALHFPTALRLGLGLPIAAALTIYAARSNRPRLLPAATLLAVPVFSANVLTLLTAIPRMRADHDKS
jgi:Glycosyltransferase family 87